MAYSLPELVLVGAAEALVLTPSCIKTVGNCLGVRPQDEDWECYNEEPPW